MLIRVSVVIPTYKRPQLLRKCLQAVIAQCFPAEAYEIIVVNDGPDRLSESIIEKPKGTEFPVIRFLSLDENRGPAAARNLGWKHAHGDLIVFTDDDCLPQPQWLSALWHAYRSSAQLTCFSGKTVVPVSPRPTDYELNIRKLSEAEFITANCACPKKALELAGGFDERFRMAWREDSDLHFKLIQLHIPVVKVNDAVVIHPVRQAPWGVSIFEQKKSMFNALLYKKFPVLYRQKIKPQPAWHYYIIVSCFLGFAFAIAFNVQLLNVLFLSGWMASTGVFLLKRLLHTCHSISHIAEMVVTSVFIPFLSLFWNFYGAWKYRVLVL